MEDTEYTEKLQALETEKQLILDGSHPELVRQKQVLGAVRDRKLRDAELAHRLRVTEINQLHDYELKAAEDIFVSQVADLTSKLLNEVSMAQHKLNGLKSLAASGNGSIGNQDGGSGNTRALRSKNVENLAAQGSQNQAAQTTMNTENNATVNGNKGLSIPEKDLLEDLRKIVENAKAETKGFQKVKVGVETEDDIDGGELVLVVEGKRYNVGQQVGLVQSLSGEEIIAEISAIRRSEIEAKISDDMDTGVKNKVRVPLTHIEHGRVRILPQSNLNIPVIFDNN